MLKQIDALLFLKKLRHIDNDMPIAQAHMFMLVAEFEGLSLKELAKLADVKMATASRYISSLGTNQILKEPGLGLVEARENPAERRKKIITLTDKGRALVKDVLDVSKP